MNILLGHALPKQLNVFRIDKRQFLLLAIISVLILCRNFFFMVDGLGEQDAARLMNDAILWHHTDSLPFTDYRAKISSGYIAIIKILIDIAILYENIIKIINSANAVFGAILIFFSFFLFRLFFAFSIAVACTIMLSFVPSVFVFSIYGFPTLIAYTAFSISLLLFYQSNIIYSSLSTPLLVTSSIALSIGTILKADIILLAGGYLGIMLAFGCLSPSTLLKATFVVVIGAVAPIAFKFLLLPDTTFSMQKVASFAQNWNERFPLTLSYFFCRDNIEIMARSVGLIFVIIAIIGGVLSVLREDTRRYACLIILFALPLGTWTK